MTKTYLVGFAIAHPISREDLLISNLAKWLRGSLKIGLIYGEKINWWWKQECMIIQWNEWLFYEIEVVCDLLKNWQAVTPFQCKHNENRSSSRDRHRRRRRDRRGRGRSSSSEADTTSSLSRNSSPEVVNSVTGLATSNSTYFLAINVTGKDSVSFCLDPAFTKLFLHHLEGISWGWRPSDCL